MSVHELVELVTNASDVTDATRAALEALGPAIAIDSSLGTSVAVSNGSKIVTFAVDDHLSHAEVVATLMTRALHATGVTFDDIEHVVAGMGPGPFTGLRVGIAAAQGFATGRKLPVLPLISHEAVALSAFTDDAERTQALVVTDARRKEFFVTHFGRPDSDGIPTLLAAPALYPRAELGEAAESADVNRIDPVRVDAASLIKLAALRRHAGREFAAHSALYLRSPDVTPSAGPKRVGS